MEELTNQLGYYCVIPAPIMRDGGLSSDEKILYGTVSGMAREKGYCWAGNDTLAKIFPDKEGKPKDERTIRRWLNHLEEVGYIKRTLVYFENTNQIKERRIYLTGKCTPIPEGDLYNE